MDPFTIGVALSLVNLAVLINAHGRKVWVPRVGEWVEPPPVLLSHSAPVTKEQVEEAITFWRNLGHEIGDVTETAELEGPFPDTIFIGLGTQEWQDGLAGRATWTIDWPELEDEKAEAGDHSSNAAEIIEVKGGAIQQAVIDIDPLIQEEDKVKVLIHEFGHALGYLHVEVALLGRRKKDSKNGKRKAGDARGFLGLKILSRPSGHIMNPRLSLIGDYTKPRNQKGLKEDEDE